MSDQEQPSPWLSRIEIFGVGRACSASGRLLDVTVDLDLVGGRPCATLSVVSVRCDADHERLDATLEWFDLPTATWQEIPLQFDVSLRPGEESGALAWPDVPEELAERLAAEKPPMRIRWKSAADEGE